MKTFMLITITSVSIRMLDTITIFQPKTSIAHTKHISASSDFQSL